MLLLQLFVRRVTGLYNQRRTVLIYVHEFGNHGLQIELQDMLEHHSK